MSDQRYLTGMTAADWRRRIVLLKQDLLIAELQLVAALENEKDK
jgi:hypothetical protein